MKLILMIRMTGTDFDAIIRNVKNALERLYNSEELNDIVIENTNDKVPKLTGFLRWSAIRYKSMYRMTSSTDMMQTQVRYRALNVRKDMKNIGASNNSGFGRGFSHKDLVGDPFNYAHIQEVHEYDHYTTAGTGSHYLQKGLEESIPEIKEKTRQTVAKAIKKGK